MSINKLRPLTFHRDVDGGNYGQNIAAGVKADNVSAVITELFYNGEVSFYDGMYSDDPKGADPPMTNFHEWGHFSQMVWVDTTEVGCATVDCSSKGLANTGGNVGAHFTVCNYKSQGKLVSILNLHHTTLTLSQATWEVNTPATFWRPVATPPATGTTACRHLSTPHPICGLLRLRMRARLATDLSSRKLTTAMHLLFLLPTWFLSIVKTMGKMFCSWFNVAKSQTRSQHGKWPVLHLARKAGKRTAGTSFSSLHTFPKHVVHRTFSDG